MLGERDGTHLRGCRSPPQRRHRGAEHAAPGWVAALATSLMETGFVDLSFLCVPAEPR